MHKFLVLVCSLILYPYYLFCQGCALEVQISSDDSGPVEYASVGLFQDSLLIGGSLSNEKGACKIEVPCGTYRLQIKHLGFETYETQIEVQAETSGQIQRYTLNPKAYQLDEITIKEKIIERRADRLIFNNNASFQAKGQSAIETLQLVPGVWMNSMGGFSINGKRGAKIMVNGKLLKLSGPQLQSFLQGLSNESILKVEVISNPGAEFDAEGRGGIINLVLKKRVLDGFNSNFFVGYEQGRFPEYSTGVFSNFKKGKLTTTANFYIFQRNSFTEMAEDRTGADNNLNTESLTKLITDNHQLRLGTDYQINDNQNINIEYVRTFNNNDLLANATSTASSNTLSSSDVTGVYDTDSRNIYNSITLNYDWKLDTLDSQLRFLADYVDNFNRTSGLYASDYFGSDQRLPLQ